jgi:hypothetical protein
MTRLILTTCDSGAGGLMLAGVGDIVLYLNYRFVWGRVPSDSEYIPWLTPRPTPEDGDSPRTWNLYRRHFGEIDRDEIGLIDFCERCETIDLWVDPAPNAQLVLIWLLNYLRPYEKIVSRLTLLQADVSIGNRSPKRLAKWRLPVVKISQEHMETAGAVWRAYCAPTPQSLFSMLSRDLSMLPQLRQTVQELLEELPMPATGLGATEIRMLALASKRRLGPFELFPGYRKPNKRRVYEYWEVGALLDGLAHGPAPALSGLNEGPFTMEIHRDRPRYRRYKGSRLSITRLGKAVLAGTDDFSRYNPIDRWWGGTHLTSDNLWRWDPADGSLIAP